MFKTSRKAILPLAAALGAALALPAIAGSRMEREFDLAPGGRLLLDSDLGSVTVRGGSGSTATVVITSRHDDMEDRFEFGFTSSDDELSIDVDKRGKGKVTSWLRSGFRNENLQFDIEVPRDTRVEIDTAGGAIDVRSIDAAVDLDTSGGSIEAEDIGGEVRADTSGGKIIVRGAGGDVDADTSGGSIEIEDVRGDVVADTSGGNITVREVDGDVNADTSGGSIRIEEVGGQVAADTSGGSIGVIWSSGRAEGGSLSTSGGTIVVEIDPSASLQIDASASGGSVKCDVPIKVRGTVSKTTLKGEIGGGGPLLRMRTSGGSIHIRSR